MYNFIKSVLADLPISLCISVGKYPEVRIQHFDFPGKLQSQAALGKYKYN